MLENKNFLIKFKLGFHFYLRCQARLVVDLLCSQRYTENVLMIAILILLERDEKVLRH